MNIAIIPARKSSKRIKNKNIINFFGRPMIAHTIQSLIKMRLFDKIIVSSDSQIILNIAKKNGAETFKRSHKLSTDKVPTFDVIKNVIKNLSYQVDNVCCLYSTSLFIKKKYILDSFKILKRNKNSLIMSVCKYTHPIERSFFLKKNNELTFRYPKNKLKQTQSFKSSYYDAAQFAISNSKFYTNFSFKKKSKILGYVLDDSETTDIDTKEDLIKAKKIYKRS